MMHLYWAENFHRLEKLLKANSNVTKFDHKEQTSLFGLNVWIIYVAGKSNRENLQKILQKSPVGLNSHVFEFFEPVDGTFLKNLRIHDSEST